MNKSHVVHYKNKYFGGKVDHSEHSLDVYDADGELRVSLRKNGAGMLQDVGAEFGALDRHDLSPIPKDARCFKLYPDGRIGKSEEYEQRKAASQELVVNGKILSIAEYAKHGVQCDAEGNVKWPEKVAAPAKVEPPATVTESPNSQA